MFITRSGGGAQMKLIRSTKRSLTFQVDELGHISTIIVFPLMLEELIFFPCKASSYVINSLLRGPF